MCARCGGRFLARDVVQRVVVDELGVAQETLVELAGFFRGATAPCPSCATAMRPVRLRGVPLDLCASCGGAWCDAGELARLSGGRHEEVRVAVDDHHGGPQPATRNPQPSIDDAGGLLHRLKLRVAAALDVVDAAIEAQRPPPDPDAFTPVGKGRPGAQWAVVQESTAPLDVERVRAAFARTARWAPADAPTTVAGAHGILVDGVTQAEAEMLRDALAAEGVRVDVVASDLLALPPPRATTRMDVDDDGLHPRDQHGEVADVPWTDVVVVGAATVRARSTKRTYKPKRAHGLRGIGPRAPAPDAELDVDVVDAEEIVAEVVLRDGRRLRATSTTFVFGARVFDRPAAFAALVAAIARRATDAALTAGAVDARDGRTVRRAKTPQALAREVAWHRSATTRPRT